MEVILEKNGVNLLDPKTKGKQTSIPSKASSGETGPLNDAELDHCVGSVIRSLKSRQTIPTEGSKQIVCRIRFHFVNAIRKNVHNSDDIPFSYDVDSFKYLDDILFNRLEYIIGTVIQNGSHYAALPISDVITMISGTAKLIEYRIPDDDYAEIRAILKEVYNAF